MRAGGTADPAVDEEIHKEAAELVEEGAACLRALEQSPGSKEEANRTVELLRGIRNISDKVRYNQSINQCISHVS